MEMEIKEIGVNNFKSIRELKLALGKINVLIGSNGAGKSNFISLLVLLNKIIEGKLQIYVAQNGGADNLLYFGRKTSAEIVIDINFRDNRYQCRLQPTTEDNLFFADERVFYDPGSHESPYEESLGSGHKETNLFDQIEISMEARGRGGVAEYVADAFRLWKVYHFHDTSASSRIKQTCNINNNQSLEPDASNLAAFLYMLQKKHEKYFRRIEETIRLAAPFFGRFDLKPQAMDESRILLEWREKGTDQYFNAHNLSDGTLRMICLCTLLLQPRLPDAIIIDEPELGLHPYAIELLASLLKSVDSQVIVATQSVTLINHFAPSDIIVVDREDNQSVFRRLDESGLASWLEEYAMGELWEKNIIGGRP